MKYKCAYRHTHTDRHYTLNIYWKLEKYSFKFKGSIPLSAYIEIYSLEFKETISLILSEHSLNFKGIFTAISEKLICSVNLLNIQGTIYLILSKVLSLN